MTAVSARREETEPAAVHTAPAEPLPLVRRFPGLRALPRARLTSAASLPTPVEDASALARGLWIKRDDRAAEPFGGNKVRALEFLLGGLRSDERVITVGSRGSTHALATAVYARQLGSRAAVYLWPQEMNEAAEIVARRIEAVAAETRLASSPITAYLRATAARLRGGRWIPAGGSTPLGVLGAVNAGPELARQVAEGQLPAPKRIVVPLGSGGTAAGLLLGTEIAGLRTQIVGVRVVPRLVGTRRRVLRLARGAARLVARYAGEAVPAPRPSRMDVLHDYYGGAYGRVTDAGAAAAARAAREVVVDPTYGAKALAAALSLASPAEPVLFWLTFDARMLH